MVGLLHSSHSFHPFTLLLCCFPSFPLTGVAVRCCPRWLSPHIQPRYPAAELHELPGMPRRRLPLALHSMNTLPSAFPPRPQHRVGILGPSHLLPATDGALPRPGRLRDFSLFYKLSDSPWAPGDTSAHCGERKAVKPLPSTTLSLAPCAPRPLWFL